MPLSSSPSLQEEERKNPYRDPESLEFNFRARRFQHIRPLIEDALDEAQHINILDLGGTEEYWRIGADFLNHHRHKLKITLLNLEAEQVEDTEIFEACAGDAADPLLLEGERFDLVHSNSVVEHMGSWDRMQRFAENSKRLSRRYFVQTPNYWFPFEPHFRLPGFQYLSKTMKVSLVQRFQLGFFPRTPDRGEACDLVRHNTLISATQMQRLFDDGTIVFEKFAFLNKSIMAVRAR
ncbi:class I SAM-dependent methyltransferase [Nitratireductor kimnyeongensis]|uniref:Class I SAM-dependent methyltransferase n=1 Tax=Nitratireductor kimnyeongensis TaxID=430679 RepID=A0ABW0T8V8_9HYPH|nr:class I SAM-dependent methyltransferase [Nitratireductor kimnyeongensis]QZZ36313.1 class I SAM-dependent methyltransferase [Nitratireductor kimnyeongensis]